MNNPIEIDADEGRETVASNSCYNCRAKSSDGTWLNDYTTPEGLRFQACDDCIAEAHRVEQEACELADRPGCDERLQLIDKAQTVNILVNRLKAHDQAGCPACAAVRSLAPCDDCGQLVPSHQLLHDDVFHLDLCAACNARQLRHDAIIERHNADVRRVA